MLMWAFYLVAPAVACFDLYLMVVLLLVSVALLLVVGQASCNDNKY